MKKTVVLALGGNALLQEGQRASITTQFRNAKNAAKSILKVAKNNDIIITHGNGPQVGNILLQVEAAAGQAYKIPLEVCVAESQGEIGYILEQSLQNQSKKNLPIISVLTQVLVNKKDPAFKNSTKFIGPFYTKQQAMQLQKKGMKIKRDSNRGYRRVVPSPKPLQVLEAEVIKKLMRQHTIVIAAGGGGIPVIKSATGYKGIEAVIDKDLASACLADSLKAEILVMLTAVPYAYLNYGTSHQEALKHLPLALAEQYLEECQFPPGSMGPKIQAAINFLRSNPNGKVIITEPRFLEKALKGKAGTQITK